MLTWRCLAVLCFTASVGGAAAGCSGPHALDVDKVHKKASALVQHACQDSFDSVYENPGNLSTPDDPRRGDIVRCAKGDAISAEALQAALAEAGFYDVEVKRSVQLYRIMYRTQRAFRGADVASALVVIPNESVNGQALKVETLRAGEQEDDELGPLVVYGHGTTPYRQDCAVSRADPLTATFLGEPDRELRTVLALAAQGWPVIAPDYAGFVEGSPPTGYMFAEDEAYSVLDATRAMKKLLDKFPEQSVLVGHSQGGHAVLAAQAYARSYGADGQIKGVVAFAPFWAPARAFGVIISPESGYTTDDPTGVGGYALNTAVEYFYTHAELIEGRGRNILRFEIDDLLGARGSECNYFPDLTPYGRVGTDLLEPGFAAVAACAPAGIACEDPLAQTWSERFRTDRPALDPNGAPVLLWQGAQDTVVPLSIAGCGIDKIRQDFENAQASLKLCADPTAEHELVESNNAAHAIQWINARVHGADEPTQTCDDQSVLKGLDCFIGNHD